MGGLIEIWQNRLKERKYKMNYVSMAFGIVFIITGILFALGKVHKHIGAWKRMSTSEKDKIRIKELCRNLGEVIALSGIIFFLNGILPSSEINWFVIAMVAWLIIAGLDLFYIYKSKRFIKKDN